MIPGGVSEWVYKWQSLPVEDSLFSQQSANGSLFQQKTVCSLSHNRVYKWRFPPVEDSLFPRKSTNGSLSPRKDSLSVKSSRDRQMAVSSNSLSVSGMFSSPQSRRMAVFLLGKQFVDSPGTSRRMAVFTPKTVRPPSNKVISPSKERGPTWQSFKDAKSKGKMVKFLYYRQM